MAKQEFDMEVSEYRALSMLDTLAFLLADQMGKEVASVRHYRVDENGNKIEELTRKEVI